MGHDGPLCQNVKRRWWMDLGIAARSQRFYRGASPRSAPFPSWMRQREDAQTSPWNPIKSPILYEIPIEFLRNHHWNHHPIGSVCMPYMVCHLPSIYPSFVSINLPYMDPSWVWLFEPHDTSIPQSRRCRGCRGCRWRRVGLHGLHGRAGLLAFGRGRHPLSEKNDDLT